MYLMGVDVLQVEGVVSWGFNPLSFQWVSIAYLLKEMYSICV